VARAKIITHLRLGIYNGEYPATMQMTKKRTAKLTAAEVKRFEDLAVIKYDEEKPLDTRAKAASEVARWTDGKTPELICNALIPIAQNEEKPIEVRLEANGALLQLKYEKSAELVCTVFRGLRRNAGDEVAVCSKCGKDVEEEAHGPGDCFPGLYCSACCPACSLIPRERLKEVPMTTEVDNLMEAHGLAHAEPFAREVVWIVRRDHWNISPGVN